MSALVPKSPAHEALETGEQLLVKYAISLGLNVEAKPGFAGQVFSGGSETSSARLEPADLPNHVRGLQVGRYAVLLALLPEVPDDDDVVEVVRRVRNQCVVARSHLSSAASLDLHAILIGPRGSEGVDRWKALALIAERDERVARKLVWLRPVDVSADEQSFADFAKRSFLARPWVTGAIFSMAPLDNVGRLAAFEGVPLNTAGEWIRFASNPDLDPDLLVDQLVVSWKRRTSS